MTDRPKFPRGSEWRKWDLHVHTPLSILNNQFGSDFDAYAEAFFRAAIDNDVAVVGVTDYFIIDGYENLRERQQNRHWLEEKLGKELAVKAADIVLLPNVEFRVDPIVRVGEKDSRVNLHVIFSSELTCQQIRDNFLERLEFSFDTEPQRPVDMRLLKKSALEEFGKALQETHEKFREKSPLQVGAEQVWISHDKISNVLSSTGLFRGKYLIVVAADEDLSALKWDGQGHAARKQTLRKADALFTAYENTRKLFLGQLDMNREAVVKAFGSIKPSLTGSDAHEERNFFVRPRADYTWIKADKTFRGLYHAILEAPTRVFIGKEPPQLANVRKNATKYISELTFDRTAEAREGETWFNGRIQLNAGLVAIIGNKGSGKSALADVIGLLGESSIEEGEYSFLNRERFRHPREGRADGYAAKIVWASTTGTQKTLDTVIRKGTPESVKYLPQRYVEQVCNAISHGDSAAFDKELRAIVFSHMAPEDRLGCETLDQYIEKRVGAEKKSLQKLREQLFELNVRIASIEDILSPESRVNREKAVETKERELKTHDAVKPPAMAKPEQDEETQKRLAETQKKIDEAKNAYAEVLEEIRVLRSVREDASEKVTAATAARKQVQQLSSDLARWREQIEPNLQKLGMSVDQVATVTLHPTQLEELEIEWIEKREVAKMSLESTAEGSLTDRRTKAATRVSELTALLDQPSRDYRQHIEKLEEWESARLAIVGSDEEPGTLRWAELQLKHLEELPSELQSLRDQRVGLAKEIHAGLEAVVGVYRDVYTPLQERALELKGQLEGEGVQVEAALEAVRFEDRLLELINQTRKGQFMGIDEGRERATSLVKEADLSTWDGVRAFAKSVEDALKSDGDYDNGSVVRDQLKKGRTTSEVYQLVYGFEYLEPQFNLQWNGRQLSQLSPGERGTLLLLFYLLVDKSDLPLIIDQPEENLDNQTVYNQLVQAIRHARERRQIIVVTHNPNIAVVCDADQVIHAHLDKADGHTLTYTTGSIEDPVINKLLMDVLEGTEPAFNNRDTKYFAERTK